MIFLVFERLSPAKYNINRVFEGSGEQSMVFIVFEKAQSSKVWYSLCFRRRSDLEGKIRKSEGSKGTAKAAQ